jgi:predicted deacylase
MKDTPNQAGVVTTGDVVNGKPVIERLDAQALATGTHCYYFSPLRMVTGTGWQIPVAVIKGSEQGLRAVITAGVHGDELNSVVTAQQLIQELNPDTIRGSVVIVPELNIPGLMNNCRDFVPSDADSSTQNLNRIFPGDPSGIDPAKKYVGEIWRRLLLPNADIALDLHTQSRGTVYPVFVFADFRNDKARAMAEHFGADMILDDPGMSGVLETTWNANGVPCITIEIGAGGQHQPDLVIRGIEGIRRVLAYSGLLAEQCPAPARHPIVGNEVVSIRADRSGYGYSKVSIGDTVEAGQEVAILRDSFGFEVARYSTPVAGHVVSIHSNPLREYGSLLVRVLRHA